MSGTGARTAAGHESAQQAHAIAMKPGVPRGFLSRLRTPVLLAVYQRQIYFSGVQAASLVTLVGATLAWVVFNLLHQRFHNGAEFTLRILATTGLQELAPVIVTVLLVAGSVSAIVTELATMKVNGEIRMLQRHGIAPLEYLVVPRMIGFMLGSAMLFVYFSAGVLITGSLLAAPVSPLAELYRLAQDEPWNPALHGLLRSILLSGIVAVAACVTGLRGPGLSSAVPRTAGRAVILSLVLLFSFDGIATYLNA